MNSLPTQSQQEVVPKLDFLSSFELAYIVYTSTQTNVFYFCTADTSYVN